MKAMVKVSIADVLGIENTDEEMARTTQQFVVVLKQDGGNERSRYGSAPQRPRRL